MREIEGLYLNKRYTQLNNDKDKKQSYIVEMKDLYLKEFDIKLGIIRAEVSEIKKETSRRKAKEIETYLIWKLEPQRQNSTSD